MISKTIGFRGLAYFQTHPHGWPYFGPSKKWAVIGICGICQKWARMFVPAVKLKCSQGLDVRSKLQKVDYPFYIILWSSDSGRTRCGIVLFIFERTWMVDSQPHPARWTTSEVHYIYIYIYTHIWCPMGQPEILHHISDWWSIIIQADRPILICYIYIYDIGPTRDFGVADTKPCRLFTRKRLWRKKCLGGLEPVHFSKTSFLSFSQPKNLKKTFLRNLARLDSSQVQIRWLKGFNQRFRS